MQASNLPDEIAEVIDRKFSDIQTSITATINTALAACLTTELSKITATLTDIKTDINKLNRDNTTINQTLAEVKTRLDDIDNSLQFTSSRQDSQETRLEAIESNVSTYKEQASRIHVLECTIDKMEQQARMSNLEICNIPEKRGENLVTIFNNIGTAIRITFTPGDIVSIHRVPHANPNSSLPKNIIVRLTSVMLRDNILAAFRTAKGINTTQLALSGPTQKIYLNEHLTLKNKLLLRRTREAASKHNYKYVWVRHASILVRKEDTSPVLAIRSDLDLLKLSATSS
ncbi:uncharacterized protein LOC134676469 [Cydia fagiglandana]|uniref:uncharacterized protein LOC134676469 n=1 Tax=Cydia fagiglandana TaxID=1458189 RepID=UPI002FEE1741